MRIASIIILILWIILILSASNEKDIGIVAVFLAWTLVIPLLYILYK